MLLHCKATAPTITISSNVEKYSIHLIHYN